MPLVTLCGFPCSGKSTAAAAIAKAIGDEAEKREGVSKNVVIVAEEDFHPLAAERRGSVVGKNTQTDGRRGRGRRDRGRQKEREADRESDKKEEKKKDERERERGRDRQRQRQTQRQRQRQGQRQRHTE